VWEHAYYLRYANNRANYINAFMNQICWRTVEKRFTHNKEKKYGCQ
jgi:Fe-Mn family superoxide dismutase